MVDIARLGFSADTGQLKSAKAALETLVPSAQKAEKATENFNRAAAGVGVNASKMAAAAQGAAAGASKVGAAAQGATQQTYMLGNGFDLLTGKVNKNFVAINKAMASWDRIPAAANGAASSLNRLGAAANDNINRLQATPGNIAAQFQDIGVSAAGGMQPWLIAMQQGTQLSAAMSGGLGNLLGAFRQLLSPTTLLTIGIVGLVAAGLQMVDWVEVGQSALNGLADIMETTAVAAAYLGVVLAIAFAPQIIARIGAMAVTIGGALLTAIKAATGALVAFAVANPFGFIVLAIGAVIGAMVLLNDAFGGAFTNILSIVKDVANGIIRFFANAFNIVARNAEKLINKLIDGFNTFMSVLGVDVQVGSVDFSGAQINLDRDFVGDAAAWISEKAAQAADWLRGLAASIGLEEPAKGKAGSGQSEAEKALERYADLIQSTQDRIAALQVEARALGMTEEAARAYRNEQELMAAAIKTGIPINEQVIAQIKGLASALTEAEINVEIAKQTKAFKDQQQTLQDQADLIGLTGYALEYATRRQELLNDAVSRGITITDDYNKLLDDRATKLATDAINNETARKAFEDQAEAQKALTDGMAERLDAARNAVGGFFADWYDGIRNGINIFKSFADSVVDGLNRILDKLMDRAITGLLDNIFSGSSGGGFLGGLFGSGFLGGLFGSASSGPTNSSGLSGIYANGGAFEEGIQRFAKGGAFTNSIVNTPTLFKFAKGAGMMGEAGPEAIMPLKRGPDGSLGVEMHGGGRGTQVIQPVINVYNDNRVEGAMSSQDIIALQQRSAQQTEDTIRRRIPEIMQQYQTDGSLV